MRNKLITYIMQNYVGMHEFRKEYAHITDKMLIEDTRMLLKLFPNNDNTELTKLLNKFVEGE